MQKAHGNSTGKAPWTAKQIPSQSNKIVVVTGTGGLGYETALELSRAGAEVILAGRNPAKGAESVQKILAQAPQAKIRFEELDLADLTSVQAFSAKMKSQLSRIDILVNNAGVMAPPQRRTTKDGFELQFGTNFLGHYALTAQLLPLLIAANGARVVNVASVASMLGKFDFTDLNYERQTYNPMKVYGQSKLANLIFSLELQRQSDKHGWKISSIASHPGFSTTDLMANGPGTDSLKSKLIRAVVSPLVGQPPPAGALPSLFAAVSPDAKPGHYYGPDKFFEMNGHPTEAKIRAPARDTETARKLWDAAEKLTHASFRA